MELTVVNEQPVEKQTLDPDGKLEVVEVFHTIQGEGPFAGQAAVFVRLAGCNLKCPACDTDYTSRRETLAPEQVYDRVVAARGTAPTSLLVLTGGEPFRQNITPLCRFLNAKGWDVQIETNGTLALDDFPYLGVTIVVSPKTPAVHPVVAAYASAFKYVIEAGYVDPGDGLPTRALASPCGVARPPKPGHTRSRVVYVQPMDGKCAASNAENAKAAVDSCMNHGLQLCLQLHKFLGLP